MKRITMTQMQATIARNTAVALPAILAIAALTGCYTSSKTALGFQSNDVIQSEFAVSDSIGAAMFSEHVRVAHAEANHRRLMREEFANVVIPND